jgi:hypothetical protein
MPMVKKGTLSGINWVLVGVGYLVLFVVTAVVFFLRYMWGRRSRKGVSRPVLSTPLREGHLSDPYSDD